MWRWGRMFDVRGSISLADLADVVQAAFQRFGFTVALQEQENGSINLRAVRDTVPPRWLPSCCRTALDSSLRLDGAGGRATWHLDRAYSLPYRLLLAVLTVPSGWLWGTWLFRYLAVPPTNFFVDPSTLTLLLAAVGTMGLHLYLLARDSGGPVNAVVETVRLSLRSDGLLVEQRFSSYRDRRTILMVAALGHVVGTTCVSTAYWALSSPSAWSRVPGIPLELLGPLACCILLGVSAFILLFLVLLKKGADERLSYAGPGLFQILSLTYLLGAQIPLWSCATISVPLITNILSAQDAASKNQTAIIVMKYSDHTRSAAASELLEQRTAMRSMATVVLFLPFGMVLVATALLLAAVAGAHRLLTSALRIRTDVWSGRGRAAATAEGFMGLLRIVLPMGWLASSIMHIFGLSYAMSLGFLSIFPGPAAPTGPMGPIRGTARVIEFFFQLSPNNGLVEALVRCLCVLYVGSVIGIYLLSVVSYLRYLVRCRQPAIERRRLRSAEAVPDVQGLVDEISKRLQCAAVVTIVTRCETAYARTHWNLLLRSHVLEISTGTIRSLDTAELGALVCHELGHVRLGHCRRHAVLHLLGQLTGVGSAFVGSLMGSFQWELAADRCAVLYGGVDIESLRRCLVRMQVARLPVGGEANGGPPGSLRLMPVESCAEGSGAQQSTWWSGFGLKWRSWLHYYRADIDIAYWHPAISERLRVLTELQWTLERVSIRPEGCLGPSHEET